MPAKCLTACVVAVVSLCFVGFGGVVTAHHGLRWAEPTLQDLSEKPKPLLKLIDYGTKDPRLKGYFLLEGFKLEIVAEGPVVGNIVGMQFDEKGTLHVVTWPQGIQFRHETRYVKNKNRWGIWGLKKPPEQTLKSLHDLNGDGVFDEAKTIEVACIFPTSLLFHGDGLYLADSVSWRFSGEGGDKKTGVRRFRRSTPGGPFDVQENVIGGFFSSLAPPVNGVIVGNDGWLYTTGSANHIKGTDGSQATAPGTGILCRCRPDGSRLQVLAQGFRRSWSGMVFDANLHRFHADNHLRNWEKQAVDSRILHVLEDADYGGRVSEETPEDVSLFPGQRRFEGERPGSMPALCTRKDNLLTSLLSYNDKFLPERFHGVLLSADANHAIKVHRLEPRGASFLVLEEYDLLRAEDPKFLPRQMLIGPDGAIYIADQRNDPQGHGRIYRLTWAGVPDEPAIPSRPLDSWHKIITGGDEQVFQALSSPNFTDRCVAARELARRGEKHRPALVKMVLSDDASAGSRIAALGALQSLWNEEVQAACLNLLRDANPDLRRMAAEAISLDGKPGDASAVETLVKALSDRDLSVRRAVALAVGKAGGPVAADALVNAYRFDDGKDPFLHDGLIRAIERLGPLGMDRLISLAESGQTEDLQRAVRAFAVFRARPAAEAVPRLMANPHLTENDVQSLLRSYQNYQLDPPISLEPVLEWLERNPNAPAPTKQAALEGMSVTGTLKGELANKLLLDVLRSEENEGVRIAALHVVLRNRMSNAAPVLTEMLHHQRSTAERKLILEALVLFKEEKALPVLESFFQEESWADLYPDLVRSLVLLNEEHGNKVAARLLEHRTPAVVRAAIEVLGCTPAGAKQVGQAFLDKKLPRDYLPDVVKALGQYPELARMREAVQQAK